MRPKLRTAELEIRMRSRLVPEDLILQLIRLRVVIDHQTLKVLRALVHDLAEGIEIGEHTGILVVELAPIVDDVLAQNKDVVDVRAQRRWNTHRVLHRDNKHGMHMAPVHEEISDIAITDPRRIEQTVIENQEIAGIDGGGPPLAEILGNLFGDELLALQNIGDNQRRIFLVNKHRRDNLTVELIRPLRTGYNSSTRETLVVPEQILYQEGFACFALADEHDDLVVFDLGHIEFSEFQIQSLWSSAPL